MQSLIQILSHTPAWVYILLFYLVSRGVKAMKPAEVTPLKLAIVPALLTGWGLADLVRLYTISAANLVPWISALAAGSVVGWLLVKGRVITVDRATGTLKRPADYTVLPLVLIAFTIKYSFGVLAAIDPQRLAEPSFRLLDLALSGILAGIFVGKLACYLARYFGRPNENGADHMPSATPLSSDRKQ